MGYIPSELSADEARNLYSQGELSEAEARHLSGGTYDPYNTGYHCTYNENGQKGYWDNDDRWHAVKDDD
jgi:hypothetical protein